MDFVQTQGQAQGRTRATRGNVKDKKDKQGHLEDKPRTDLGQAKNKKDLQRAATKGKCNFTKVFYKHTQSFISFCVHYMN